MTMLMVHIHLMNYEMKKQANTNQEQSIQIWNGLFQNLWELGSNLLALQQYTNCIVHKKQKFPGVRVF